ncbi:MAG: metallophosphoesterase [Clostridia bacterium]|nr:metallophosphoesterase [Clostridia bacterium]
MNNPVNFYLITDTHFIPNRLCEDCEDYREYMKYEQMTLAENEAILKALFEKIAGDKETDIVIIPGDLSKNGEKESHLEFIKYLDKLRDSGKKIFVITARHDFNENASAFINGARNPVEGTKKEELAELYKDYGYSAALSRHPGSMSYVAQIAPGYRMLALDSDGETDLSQGGDKGYINSDILAWAKEQIEDAKACGDEMFAICHYPVIPSSPFFEIVKDARLENREEVINLLADSGVNLILTGHMHIQSINVVTTEKGNKFWDVCTSSIVGSPGRYRKIAFDGATARIESFEIPDFEWDLEGLTKEQYLDRQFSRRITNRINRALENPKGAQKLYMPLAKKVVNSLTLGGVARLACVRIDKSLKKKKFLDFANEIGINLFKGDEPYVEGTKEYEAVSKVVNRANFIIKKVEPKLSKNKPLDLKQMIFDSIGSTKPFSDNNATIQLK